MKNPFSLLSQLPALLSSQGSIIIYILLFLYLVVFAILCLLIPSFKSLMPSDDMQLILGNYTNVLSALGASIAAGSGVAIHSKMKTMHRNHQKLQEAIELLHRKLDDMNEKTD